MRRVSSPNATPPSTSPTGGLPQHWQRGRRVAALVILAITMAVTYQAREISRADQFDAWWLEARFSLRELWHPARPDPDIVLVEMDDRSADKWKKEPIQFWGPHLAAAADRATVGGARVIALDWIQPIPLTEIVPGSGKDKEAARAAFEKIDEPLKYALNRARNVVLVKEMRTDQRGRGTWIQPTPELLYALPNANADPDSNLGFAEFSSKDNVVAAVTPALADERSIDESFSARIAEKFLGGQSSFRGNAWMVADKVAVPLRADGSFLINYANHTGHDGAFARYSLADVAEPSTPPDTRFKDKIVIIGATYTGSNELHYVPLLAGPTKTRLVYGPEIQANIVRTLLNGRPLQEPGYAGLWLVAVGLGLVGLAAFTFWRWALAAMAAVVTAILWLCLAFVLFVAADYALPVMLPLLSLFLTSSLMGGYRALREERERAEVMQLWGRYQNPRLVDYLLQHPNSRGGEGQEMIVTVLFADLKNFTKTVEHLSPTETLQVLNRYLALLNDVVEEFEGTVDKYLGDGLMAQWGAPEPWSEIKLQQNHATAAVRACLEIDRRAQALTASIGGRLDVTFSLRLTLHTGPAVVGWVGADKLEYTLIGDTVNVTSRLQETAKQLNCEFLISESTCAHVRHWIHTGQEAEVEIRGRDQPLRVFEVLGLRPADDGTEPSPNPGDPKWQKGCGTAVAAVST